MTNDQKLELLKDWVVNWHITQGSARTASLDEMCHIRNLLVADDAKPKEVDISEHEQRVHEQLTLDPADIERLARGLQEVFYGNNLDTMNNWKRLARHVRRMIDKAMDAKAEKAIKINDNWITTSQQIVANLNAKHVLALKAARREELLEVRGAFKNGTYTAQFIQIYIDRLISKLDGEGGE